MGINGYCLVHLKQVSSEEDDLMAIVKMAMAIKMAIVTVMTIVIGMTMNVLTPTGMAQTGAL